MGDRFCSCLVVKCFECGILQFVKQMVLCQDSLFGYSTKAARAQEVFGQCSQTCGGVLGAVLCRSRSWNLMIPVDPFQLRMFYDCMVLGSVRVHEDFWDKVKDWKKCMWDIGFAGPWEYQVWTRSQRHLGKFCIFLQQDWIYTPGDERTWSLWQCSGWGKVEGYQTFLLATSQLFWLSKQCDCWWAEFMT